MGAVAHNLPVVAPGNWILLLLNPGQWCAFSNLFQRLLKFLLIIHFRAVLCGKSFIAASVLYLNSNNSIAMITIGSQLL